MESIASVESFRRRIEVIQKCGDEPILLEGPTGSGKTATVEHLAHKLKKTLIKVQLGEQSDSKSILGTYCCSEIPGLFYWRNSATLEAMSNGHWLLLEDLDQSPVDVLGVLLPLLESRSLLVPGLGNERVEAKQGFRMFATSRLVETPSGYSRIQTNPQFNVVAKLFLRIIVEPMSNDEMIEAITEVFSFESNESKKLVSVYLELAKNEPITIESQGDTPPKYCSSRLKQFTMRDLLKWCQRIQRVVTPGSMTKAHALPDAFDLFAAGVPMETGRLEVHKRVANLIGVDHNLADKQCLTYQADIRVTERKVHIGRHTLQRLEDSAFNLSRVKSPKFAYTRQTSCLLESIAGCVLNSEPVLLVGETGTGKTSTVQYLAHVMNVNLLVVNMNQQSDSSDLLGAYRPVDVKKLVRPLWEKYREVFAKSLIVERNQKFLGCLDNLFFCDKFTEMFEVMKITLKKMFSRFEEGHELHREWSDVSQRIAQLETLVEQCTKAPAFSFVEGALVRAIKNGDWILLDEINLATAETLESLCGLLESVKGSVTLADRGDHEPVVRHENFRLFACMNPALDVGKKDLPVGLRSRFTEFYVDEIVDSRNLSILVHHYLQGAVRPEIVEGMVGFYQEMRKLSSRSLNDGVGKSPHFSMRTLCRALIAAGGSSFGGLTRSIYEGFCVSFLTQLDRKSYEIVKNLINTHILNGKPLKMHAHNQLPKPDNKLVECQGYLILKGDLEPHIDEGYILTPSVENNLKDLARAVAARGLPVLLQGETSVGKTSMITYLAKATGNRCFRINNHEHTDVQEYVGTYAADGNGQLVFKEGTLVKAMRKGYWIILDELNLAPSEVLEALNRLLDDNRELFIPETQETVKAHERFLVFATQNPAGLYGGRKELSRAFRNRFVELHFDEIPRNELESILHRRTNISPSHSKKLVNIMQDLQRMRKNSSLFSGKQGFITLRELFRWAERYNKCTQEDGPADRDWDQIFANQGYFLLAAKVRQDSEEEIIRQVIKTHLKKEIDIEALFASFNFYDDGVAGITEQQQSLSLPPPINVKDKKEMRKMKKLKRKIQKVKDAKALTADSIQTVPGFEHVVMTKAMKRMAVLVSEAVKHREPVLLVGETGCGKTTVCQMLAQRNGLDLLTLNCHLHTETSDFLGGLRPVRHRTENSNRLFEWRDGPLITAMKGGAMFLVDEISLADDSVLERLNSVLESERKLLLVEKGGEEESEDSEEIVANEKFLLVATMNPGGDFGKKELSPALRNRFTEIWCPLSREADDWTSIIAHNLKQGLPREEIARKMADFVGWMKKQNETKKIVVSIRDLLSWTAFVNAASHGSDGRTTVEGTEPFMTPEDAFVHGALMVFVDALQTDQQPIKDQLLQFLCQQVGRDAQDLKNQMCSPSIDTQDDSHFVVGPFKIPRGPESVDRCAHDFAFRAPTTSSNAVRVARALQLHRPILLEGSPGVGKTSLVLALAKASGRKIVRINLSDQTDVSDLFGADLPIDGGKCGEFRWVDGPLLAGLKAGHWIVLDELNLATQSVLEGLNACFDHRAEVFIPELSQTFKIDHERTRIFACQNPVVEGGDRKGLPKSFLNRFTQVYVDQLSFTDLIFILQSLHPEFPEKSLVRMVTFNQMMHKAINQEKRFGQAGGGAWDFNLRDLLRWCQLCIKNGGIEKPGRYVDTIYMMRMRTAEDRLLAEDIFEKIFMEKYSSYIPRSDYLMTDSMVQVGNAFLRRSPKVLLHNVDQQHPLRLLQANSRAFASLVECVNLNWLAILVGPSGCGKTSLLKTLSHLSGKELHSMSMNANMDTTELLGSFEQASFRKKIKAFTDTWSGIIDSTCQGFEEAKHHWMCFVQSQKAIVEEKEKIGKSLRAVEMLQKFKDAMTGSSQPHAIDLEEAICSLQESCSKVECGKFEWVDSLLLTCMKRGWWVVLDNINFCSSSVLDRLNGVLEPNGKLRLDELGTGDDGKVPEITPHPDFRLFLTMDPKNGDISRAMRNRGIEIAMLPFKGACSSDQEDLVGLLNDTGITPTVVKSVLNFHRAVVQDPELNSDVASLVRSCRLIGDRMKGVDESKTSVSDKKRILGDAFNLAYVNGCHDNRLKEKLGKLVDSALSEHFSLSARTTVIPLPGLDAWTKNTNLAMLGKASVLVRRILYSSADINVLPSSDLDVGSELTEDLALIAASLIAIQSNSSKSLRLLPQHLAKHLNKKQLGAKLDLVQQIQCIAKAMTYITGHPLVKIFLDTLGNSTNKAQLPMNVHENSAFVHSSGLTEDSVAKLLNIYRQLAVIFNWNMIGSDLTGRMEAAQPMALKHGSNASQMLSFIQLAKSHSAGLIHKESLPHAIVPQLVLYLKVIVEEIGTSLKSVLDWNDEKLNEVFEGLHWLKTLISNLGEGVVGRQLMDEKMMDASLLAKWTDKKLGAVFESSFSSNHTNLVAVLKAALDFDGRIDKFHVAAISAFGRASVFKDQSEAELFADVKSLQDKYFSTEEQLLSSNYIKVKDIAKWLRFLSNENVKRVKQTLAGLAERLAAGLRLNGDEASVATEMARIIEKEHVRIFDDDSLDDSLGYVCSEIPTSFHLMPVRNYFLSCHSGPSLLVMLSSALPHDQNLARLASLVPTVSMSNHFNELFGIALSNQQHLPKFQLIGCYLRSLQSNSTSKALPYLIGALELVKPGLPKKDDEEEEMDATDDDFDCGIIRQAKRETKSNIFTGFSNFVFEIMDPGRKIVGQSEVKDQQTASDNSWLLSAVQLKLASKKLEITKSLEAHIWTYLSIQELDTWNNIKNNVMILEECMNIVFTCVTHLSSLMPPDNSTLEKIFQTARQQLEHAKILLKQSYTNQGLFSSVGVAIGMAWLCLGQLQLKMLCPREGSVDQVRKVSIRLAGVKAMIKDANTEIALRLTNRKIQGQYLNDDDDDDDVKRLKLHLEELKTKEEKLQTKLAYRPVPSQYPELCRELARFTRDDFNAERVVEAARELASAFEDFVGRRDRPSAAKLTALVSGVQTLHGRASTFSRKFDRSFRLYPDETTGIVSALRQCEFGLDTLASCSLVELEKHSLSTDVSLGVDEMARSLSVFPITTLNRPDVLSLVDLFVSKDFLLLLRKVEEKNGSSTLINRLLRACSLLLLNSSVTSSSDRDRRKLLHLLSTVSTTYHSRWLKQEEEKRRKIEEEASIYKFKTIGSTMTEDETDAMEILRDFPTFAEDFEDILPTDALSEQTKFEPMSTKSSAVISDEDLDHFVSVYLDVMAEDKRPEKEATVDWFPYWNLVHRVTSEVFKDTTHLIDPQLEKNLMMNHLMALCFVRSSLENKQTRTSKKTLNVYKDADIGNATRCLQVLENLKNKVKEFLVQWPEHPTLVQLTVIADRILTFPVSCPPMKFTRGLEMILETAQLWMEKASKRVSLASQLEDVTKLVKTWRAAELSGWKASLDGVEEESRRSSCKWWYHLYSILQSLLKDLNDGKSKNLTRDEKLSTLRSLEELMENSPVGEFHARLRIILSFHRYLGHLVTEVADDDCKKALRTLANIFHGVYEHYQQFSAPVCKALTDLREPVEKELKDYIKIVTRSKDEDVNYFSVRSLCHKSHKAVHKFTKQYRLHLQQPVRPLMVDKLVDWQKSTEVANKPANRKRGRSKKEIAECAELFFDLTPEMFTQPSTQGGQSNNIFKKMLSFCKKIIDQSALKKNIGQLDLFNGDVLETIQYLEAMKPEGGATKEKRIKEFKRIQTMKRKSLNDLFKALKYMGLSHRKGLAHHDSTSPEEVSLHWFESSPAPSALLGLGSDQKEAQEFLVNQMKKVKNYLTRCFSRRSLLMSLLSNHHKEMDSVCLERSRGYCEHLHVEILKQKRLLADTLETFQQMRLYMNDVDSITADIPNQEIAKSWKDKSEDLFSRSAEYLHQLAFFVDAVSSGGSEAEVSEEDKAFIGLVCPANIQSNGTRFSTVADVIKDCLKCCEDSGTKTEQTLIPSLSAVDASFEKLLKLASNLRIIDEKLSLTRNSEGGATESIVSPRELIGLIESNCHGYREFKSSCSDKNDEMLSANEAELAQSQLEEFKQTCQSLATSCLKGVERLVKEIQSKKSDEVEQKDEAEADVGNTDDDVTSVTEENLISNIYADIEKCLEKLNMSRVTNQLASIVDTISNWSLQSRSANRVKKATESLAEISDILAQYGRLSQFYVTLQVSGVKETSKLNSILLRLFSELAEKGFCTPPELSEETDDSKGAEGTTFEDIEEGGMGEGEGIRDVTDQIDNEGQVEGLQSDKKEDKKDDDKKDDDDEEEDKAIEMSNDFDGELSDPRKKDGNDDDDDDDDEEGVDESEIEKQMGDVGDTGEEEKLDEKMWGDDEHEEDDDNPENKKDDHGKGTNAENAEAELGAKGAQEGDEQQEQRKDGKEEDENLMEEEEEDEDGKTAGKEADHIPDESQYDDEAEKKSSKDGLKEEEDNTEGDDLEIPEDLKIEDEGQAEAGDDAQPEEKPAGAADNDDEMGEDGEKEEKMEIDEDETKTDDKEGEDVGEKPADETSADLDKNEDDKQEENDPGLQAAPSQDQTANDGEENQDDENENAKEEENEETCLKTHHETQDVQGVADLQDTAATAQVDLKDEQKQKENQGRNLGEENSAQQDDSANKIMADSSDNNKKNTKRKRQREANQDRSVGNVEEKSNKRLKTMDCKEVEEYKDRNEDKPKERDESSTEYSHSKDPSVPHDAQVMDSATQEQLEKVQQPSSMETEESFDPDQENKMKEEEEEEMEVDEVPELQPKSAKNPSKRNEKQRQTSADDDGTGQSEEVEPESRDLVNPTNWVARGKDSFINRPIESQEMESERVDVEAYRKMVEEELMNINTDLETAEAVDQSEWSRYESSTSQLSQELCEQLRLILEPTQASKLKGDYKTGKRISMRKVIQYIASQFRKDRIWLRRTRPCKRQYQVMLAIDDSESMKCNGLEELTLESVAIIMNALSKLEVGNMGVCSFGKEVSVLHPLGKPFTNQCGGNLVKNLKFDQVSTDFVQMIKTTTGLFSDHNHSSSSSGDGSTPHRLLLIVSDGGIRNSAEWTRPAVKYARERGIFIVCIIVDNPESSIFDVMMATFHGQGKVELTPAMDSFPIPFYSVVRDAKNLPQTLADSLRQWFEMTSP